jgi:septum formation protein
MKIILGSSSPRRKEILSYFSLPFIQASPTFDESTLLFGGDPAAFVREMAEKKAQTLAGKFTDPILTADTVVYCHNRLYQKPAHAEEAFQMLTDLSGGWAQVFTGVCIHYQGKSHVKAQESRIHFHSLTEEEIRRYHKIFNWSDRAGGFYIQKAGSIIMKEIIGCFYNIMGLPITATRELLEEIGVNLWDYLLPE